MIWRVSQLQMKLTVPNVEGHTCESDGDVETLT